ncbi:hypothetical protein FLM48_11085 [Shewanella sp. Scap07]|uniref:hypothetical protein n=1 Tax=Shewanella sp. Scap07 TaxID=2589987 RepID=UPI0015BCB6CE|nr:hypothetical protein [Shewanella sp. Scap07]QLE85574.1 hypothetical protein FLM48_11085 [Shewanella sp. Scap07]
MVNLRLETLEAIKENGQQVDNIVFIGSAESGHWCSWSEFERLANIYYDDGFSPDEIAPDLTIAFSNGSRLIRYEYDGSGGWEFLHPIPQSSAESLNIKSLITNGKK